MPTDYYDDFYADLVVQVDVKQELRQIGQRLHDTDEDWEQRAACLARLPELLTHSDPVEYSKYLTKLKGPLIVQLKDLRSSVVKEVCAALRLLADSLQRYLQPLIELLIPDMLSLLGGNKVIASYIQEALRDFVQQECYSLKGLHQFFVALRHRHPSVRQTAIECILQFIIVPQNRASVEEKLEEALFKALTLSLDDATPSCRAMAAELYWAVHQLFPARAAVFLESLPSRRQRSILAIQPADLAPPVLKEVTNVPPTTRSGRPSMAKTGATSFFGKEQSAPQRQSLSARKRMERKRNVPVAPMGHSESSQKSGTDSSQASMSSMREDRRESFHYRLKSSATSTVRTTSVFSAPPQRIPATPTPSLMDSSSPQLPSPVPVPMEDDPSPEEVDLPLPSPGLPMPEEEIAVEEIVSPLPSPPPVEASPSPQKKKPKRKKRYSSVVAESSLLGPGRTPPSLKRRRRSSSLATVSPSSPPLPSRSLSDRANREFALFSPVIQSPISRPSRTSIPVDIDDGNEISPSSPAPLATPEDWEALANDVVSAHDSIEEQLAAVQALREAYHSALRPQALMESSDTLCAPLAALRDVLSTCEDEHLQGETLLTVARALHCFPEASQEWMALDDHASSFCGSLIRSAEAGSLFLPSLLRSMITLLPFPLVQDAMLEAVALADRPALPLLEQFLLASTTDEKRDLPWTLDHWKRIAEWMEQSIQTGGPGAMPQAVVLSLRCLALFPLSFSLAVHTAAPGLVPLLQEQASFIHEEDCQVLSHIESLAPSWLSAVTSLWTLSVPETLHQLSKSQLEQYEDVLHRLATASEQDDEHWRPTATSFVLRIIRFLQPFLEFQLNRDSSSRRLYYARIHDMQRDALMIYQFLWRGPRPENTLLADPIQFLFSLYASTQHPDIRSQCEKCVVALCGEEQTTTDRMLSLLETTATSSLQGDGVAEQLTLLQRVIPQVQAHGSVRTSGFVEQVVPVLRHCVRLTAVQVQVSVFRLLVTLMECTDTSREQFQELLKAGAWTPHHQALLSHRVHSSRE